MLTMLTSWKGPVQINGVRYDSVSQAILNAKLSDSENVDILLISDKNNAVNAQKRVSTSVSDASAKTEYRVTVKRYMTQRATADFDFMKKWNNDNPMPFRTMIGTVEKETRGMVYMKLHADIYAQTIPTCMRCGRALTNPVSQYFGIGPECGGHNYVNPFNSEAELKAAVKNYRAELQKVTWEGWIIKSAITEKEEIDVVD